MILSYLLRPLMRPELFLTPHKRLSRRGTNLLEMAVALGSHGPLNISSLKPPALWPTMAWPMAYPVDQLVLCQLKGGGGRPEGHENVTIWKETFSRKIKVDLLHKVANIESDEGHKKPRGEIWTTSTKTWLPCSLARTKRTTGSVQNSVSFH